MQYLGKEFKPYDSYYFVSKDGEIYSTYKHGLLKHSICNSGHHKVDIHSKHMFVHQLVFSVWNGEIPSGMQVNHLDDNKDNNHVDNLYLGTQKDNIDDCFRNHHRVGHVKSVTVYDKIQDEQITFPSVLDLIAYTGHSVPNGSLSRCLNRKWFTDRFDIIATEGVTTIESYKSIRATYDSWVENKAETHEASRVG